jgi:prepilin-type N-terminal cleavage/methylation domain-containing protein
MRKLNLGSLTSTGLNQAGDTIVEVLIAIAIVSLVLVGAYASTNHNVAISQDTQEHGQALQLVQGQVEFLRADDKASSVPACYKSAGTAATTPATDCKVSSAGASSCSAEPCFTLSITPTSGTIYKVSASWSGLTGSSNNVAVYYAR